MQYNLHVMCIAMESWIIKWLTLQENFLIHSWRLFLLSRLTQHSLCALMQLCDLLKSRVECPAFLEKLECAQASVSRDTAGTLRIAK